METPLKRELNLFDVFCAATGAMISSGLFILPGLAHAQAGPAVVLAYIVAGLLALTGMLSQAELVSAMPKAGGDYFYVSRSMGPAVGTVDGLLTWFSLSLKSAFALVGMAAFVDVFTDIDIRAISVPLCILFVLINFVGIKSAVIVQRFLVVGLLSILFLYIVGGVPEIQMGHLDPFVPHGPLAILSTAGFVFISFGGLLKVAAIAEEVKDPARTIPRGMILSLFVACLIYSLVILVTTGVLDAEVLNVSLIPISEGAFMVFGRGGMILLSIAAILAFVSTANAGIMSASRYPLALARDGLIPKKLGVINHRFKTPHISLAITGSFMVMVLFLELGILIKMASSVLLLTFLFSCMSVIVMRESRLQNYRPRFKSPFYPWVQIIGIAGSILLIVQMGVPALLASSVLIGVGFFVYWFYGHIRSTREYALLHLVERLTARDLTKNLLESELKEIIRERDEITKDRFDRIIESAIVIDVEGQVTLDEFFRQVAEAFAPRLNKSADRIFELLKEREDAGSTVIGPGLAIPHIIVNGEGIFDILLARNKKGIVFPGATDEVHAVFVLAGSSDERNFHLRALSAIAQIAQPLHFYKHWIRARDKEGLRDTVLLGERLRL